MSFGPVMIDLAGLTLTSSERELLHQPAVGGVILFSRNYKNIGQLKALIHEIRYIRKTILIAVDQEGGRVQRFKTQFTRLPPLNEFGFLYEQSPEDALNAAQQSAYTMASELISCGVDFSFAPVLDIDRGISEVISGRSFHRDPRIIACLGEAYIAGMNQAGMVAVGKHFPGHGGVINDSHYTLPEDRRSFSAIWEADLIPFVKLKSKLGGIMPAHVLYSTVDDKPACFSPYWLQIILREKLKFRGAIFSDDLSMLGAKKMGSYLERTRLALSAGCDMILICNNPKATQQVVDSLDVSLSVLSQKRLRAMRGKLKTTQIME